ncbi:adenylate cyclase [Rhizobium leguminosarum]|uniref:adenylate/guanylate cyclase domain-containing protein n=1 Tax=Rhizobium leguminosarum TaxID=384 RepID=UPI0024B34C2B|nr:adenylate/guanylate cyclase domain-containing protein [Rhizobium leguminosarum]WHO82738.1 adenylate/guanylate cyclase domain-containing protein [Rhizobium leguminosarum]
MTIETAAASTPDMIETALSGAERTGFKIAAIGRTIAITLIALAFLPSYYFPINLGIFAITLAIACIGLTSLAAIGTRNEISARFALFAFDASVVTVLLAFVPLSSGGKIPQNLVFLTSSVQYYYVVVAASVLTLSPPIVIWTGAWATGGLIFATCWILSGMDKVLSYGDLPIGPSPEIFFETVLSPNFLGIPSRVQEALIIALVTAIAALAVHRARRVVRNHARAEANERRVQRLFGRYVPAPVLRELLAAGHLAPQTRSATLLFADIEGFTRLSEGMHPTQLVQLLNEFFAAVTDIVGRNGGVVISYVGDAVLVSFNAPLPVEDHADRALAASREILAITTRQQFDGHTIRLRIGIATGVIAAGTVGADDRQTYTVYGNAVNLAQRLQELTKETNANCLICGATAQQARAFGPTLTRLGLFNIRNLATPTEVFSHADVGS